MSHPWMRDAVNTDTQKERQENQYGRNASFHFNAASWRCFAVNVTETLNSMQMFWGVLTAQNK